MQTRLPKFIVLVAFSGCLNYRSVESEQDSQIMSLGPAKMALRRSLAGRIEGEIREGSACISYVSVADPESEPGTEQGPSVRLATCDGRLIAQLNGGFIPDEWRQGRTALALLSRQERELLVRLRDSIQNVVDNDFSPDMERLAVLLGAAVVPSVKDVWLSAAPDILDETQPNAVLISSRPDPNTSEDIESWLWSGGSKRDGHTRFWRHGWKFRQTIELWSAKTVTPLGFETNDDHSGSVQHVYGESFDGTQNESWTYVSCNHGRCPGRDKMKHYTTCDPMIWTENWYNYDGECLGWWGFSHVCNDDTALQINGAYGRWNGNDCKGTKRPNRPWCGVHWE